MNLTLSTNTYPLLNKIQHAQSSAIRAQHMKQHGVKGFPKFTFLAQRRISHNLQSILNTSLAVLFYQRHFYAIHHNLILSRKDKLRCHVCSVANNAVLATVAFNNDEVRPSTAVLVHKPCCTNNETLVPPTNASSQVPLRQQQTSCHLS